MGFWTSASPVVRGIAMMIIPTVFFSLMHAMVRGLSFSLHPLQLAFLRTGMGLIVMAPWILRSGFTVFRTTRIKAHVIRSAMNIVAMFAFFMGISMTPLALTTSLTFTSPIFAGVLAVIFLGERFHLRRWSAIIVGFIGTLIILQPGLVPLELGPMLILTSAMIWGATLIVIRMLGRTESSLTITLYMSLFMSLFAAIPAFFVWTWPTAVEWGWLFAIAVTGTVAQVAIAQSLKEAEASAVMPFDSLKLIWASVLGYLVFGEIPGIFIFLGGAIIFVSSLYLAYRESVVARENRSLKPKVTTP